VNVDFSSTTTVTLGCNPAGAPVGHPLGGGIVFSVPDNVDPNQYLGPVPGNPPLSYQAIVELSTSTSRSTVVYALCLSPVPLDSGATGVTPVVPELPPLWLFGS